MLWLYFVNLYEILVNQDVRSEILLDMIYMLYYFLWYICFGTDYAGFFQLELVVVYSKKWFVEQVIC